MVRKLEYYDQCVINHGVLGKSTCPLVDGFLDFIDEVEIVRFRHIGFFWVLRMLCGHYKGLVAVEISSVYEGRSCRSC